MKKNYLLTGIISLFFTTLVWLTMVTSVKKESHFQMQVFLNILVML